MYIMESFMFTLYSHTHIYVCVLIFIFIYICYIYKSYLRAFSVLGAVTGAERDSAPISAQILLFLEIFLSQHSFISSHTGPPLQTPRVTPTGC